MRCGKPPRSDLLLKRRRRTVCVRSAVAAVLVFGIAAASPPPGLPQLSATARTALDATGDGTPRRDEAWVQLLLDAAAWPRDPAGLRAALAGEAVVQAPEWTGWVADPDPHRGTLVRFEARLDQATEAPWPLPALPQPEGGAAPRLFEWFVTPLPGPDGGAAPTIEVWVVDPPALASDRRPRSVEIAGRFLRVSEHVGRDGIARRYPTLVGVAIPAAPSASAGGTGVVILLLVLALLPLLVWLRRMARRVARAPAPRSAVAAENGAPRGDLPSDPAEALAVLRRESTEMPPR